MDVAFLHQLFSESGAVSTDTRKIIPGSVFFALRGDRFNGNVFAEEALRQGAVWAVIDDERFAGVARTTLVPDVLKALQDLAIYHRSRFSIPFIGLTGSNGKTTSKELANAVLSTRYRTVATTGNLNNHIGVPLTILSVREDTELAIIEMGANHVGEIALLCSIARPTHGFITNIGKAHIGTFGGFDNIIRGKTELYQHLITSGGTAFINSSNRILAAMVGRFSNPVLYPGPDDFIHVELTRVHPFLEVRADGGKTIHTHLTGEYNFENIATALCLGKFFGVPADDAAAAVAAYAPANMRSQVISKGTNTILLDAYNANPTSMEAAIRNLASMPAKKKVAIVGDMYELGEDTDAEHRAIGNLLASSGLDLSVVCGPQMLQAAHSFPGAVHCADRDALIAWLKANPIQDATVLVKASRGMGLEKIVDVL
ncbi:MAG: UDP-N-acetylmuramoyl-tripeptide--D-alanyl-D-alanine ligase [Bacteroidota bacterium]